VTEATAVTRESIRTPRAAAVAGIVFSVLLTVAFVLVRLALPSDLDDAGDWLTDGRKRDAVVLALNLLPFAGIAFLWFIGVVRDRIGAGEDGFFATVFLGSRAGSTYSQGGTEDKRRDDLTPHDDPFPV
jgi:hypothetical protein